MRRARVPQGGLRGSMGDGGQEGMPGRLGTEGSRRNTAAFPERTESDVVGRRAGGDRRQIIGERIRNAGVAEGAEEALTATSGCGLQKALAGVRVVETTVSSRLSSSPNFGTD